MSDAFPALKFRLVGDWYPLLVPGEEPQALISRYVTRVAGVRDDFAHLRAVLKKQLTSVVQAAAGGDVTAMLMMTHLREDVPLPLTLTVIERPDLRMSPALGMAPRTVLDVLEESFRQLKRPGLDTAFRLNGADTEILRLHTFSEERPEFEDGDRAGVDPATVAEVEQMSIRALTAEYWYAVPGSKHVVLVNFSTPLGDIPHVMLNFFDGIVRASYFEMPEPSYAGYDERVDQAQQPA